MYSHTPGRGAHVVEHKLHRRCLRSEVRVPAVRRPPPPRVQPVDGHIAMARLERVAHCGRSARCALRRRGHRRASRASQAERRVQRVDELSVLLQPRLHGRGGRRP